MARLRPLSGVSVREIRLGVGRLFERRLPAGLDLARHTHDRSLLTVVTGGGFCERFSGSFERCSVGDVRLLPAGDAHANRVDAASRCVQIELSVPAAAALADHDGTFAARGRIRGELVAALGARIAHESRIADPIAASSIDALALDLLGYAARRAAAERRQRPSWISRVEALIRDTLFDAGARDLSLAALSSCAGVHPVHLSRAFHRHYGCTIGELVRRLRVERACALMRNPKLSLSAIALECGFSDHSHFVKTFRRHLRITPGSYRRQLV